jgi:DNA (cytosine-5)-methyltransferase 1
MTQIVKARGGKLAPTQECGGLPLFIDAFSGCGGLSLGLLRSGWSGLFALEKDGFAFDTYKSNLLDGRFSESFHWPSWLPQAPTCIEVLIAGHHGALRSLRGKVALLAGGPPCQGFSSAGRRLAADPRNGMMNAYLQLVRLVEPAMVLLENVRGFTVSFAESDKSTKLVNYADVLKEQLGAAYTVHWSLTNTSDFGVPQSRTRFILVGLRRDLTVAAMEVPQRIEEARRRFLRSKRLLSQIPAIAALSDLEVGRNGSAPCADSKGFEAICYGSPRTQFQRLMRDGHDALPSDTRLARHRPVIVERFQQIIAQCRSTGRLNTSIGREMREEYGLKKMALRVLDPERPAPTITSMPDDLLHYTEPRTLTVRENARLQGFPDWFAFKGKYTTGGAKRRREVPRFTQVANAVPPPMAEILGSMLLEIWQQHLASAEPTSKPNPDASVEGDVNQHGNVLEVRPVLDQVAP